jgi:hypothetical protein
MRCTLEGSSCGSSGWRAAGAVVKGVGMASELVSTAAAGLAKDFAARLLTAIFGLWRRSLCEVVWLCGELLEGGGWEEDGEWNCVADLS